MLDFRCYIANVLHVEINILESRFQLQIFSLVIFPMDFLEHGVWGKNFAMLGLGDIVIPGKSTTALQVHTCNTNRYP